MENKELLLLKSNWNLIDIMEYYDLSQTTAGELKALVVEKYGHIPFDSNKSRGCVKADNVIKEMGGTDRLHEAMVFGNLKGGKVNG